MPTADTTIYTGEYIADVYSQATTIIGYLNSYYNSFSQTVLSTSSAPTLSTSTKFTDTDASVKTALDAFMTKINALSVGSLPTPPVLTSYTAPIWSETFWTNLKTATTTFLDTNTSLTETNALQAAMFAKDQERRQQVLRDLYSAANAQTGAKGFLFPTSMTVALQMDAQQKYQFDASTSSRDIYKFVIEWAKSNYQFSIEKGVAAHGLDIEFNMKYAATLLDSYRATMTGMLESYKEQTAALAMAMEAQIKEYTARLEVFKTNALIDSEMNKALIAGYAEDIKNHVEHANAQANINLEAAKAKSSAATAALNGLTALANTVQQIAIKNF